jgi:hypothetical protein
MGQVPHGVAIMKRNIPSEVGGVNCYRITALRLLQARYDAGGGESTERDPRSGSQPMVRRWYAHARICARLVPLTRRRDG